MIPSAERLEEISRMREGSLAEVPFAALLYALGTHERTLVLEMKKNQLAKKVIIEFGVPVDCRSNLIHETLGRFMASSGKITLEQAEEAWKASVTGGKALGEILIERGFINAQELFRTLQANLAKKLLDCFSWKEGDFRMAFDIPKVESPLKVKVPQLIITGISRFASKGEVDAAVGGLVGRRLFLNPFPQTPLEELRLGMTQLKLVGAMAKGKRIDELAMETGIPYEEITRLLYALALIGLVVPEDQLPKKKVQEKPPEPPVAAPQMQVAPAPSPRAPAASAAEVEKISNEVMHAYLSYRKQDPFELLGVDEGAQLPAIRAKYLEFARKYGPAAFDRPELKGVADKAADIFLAGALAYAQLSDYDRRNELISARRSARESGKRAGAPDAFAIKTDLLDPEVQYKKGKALLAAQEYQQALHYFEFAADCDPQNGNYMAEAAFCRYLYSPLLAKQALGELREAMRIDPKSGLAYIYTGRLLAETGGSPQEAEALLLKAAQLMPGDPRPKDLARTLLKKKI